MAHSAGRFRLEEGGRYGKRALRDREKLLTHLVWKVGGQEDAMCESPRESFRLPSVTP